MVATLKQKPCNEGWKYDHTKIFPTITSEVAQLPIPVLLLSISVLFQNDWVCEEDYKPMLIHTFFWVGNILGCFVWGLTTD